MSIISSSIEKAVALLNQEQIIGIPTETVYGLAGNIYSSKAIERIYAMKKRPFFNPLIVHIKSATALSEIARDIPEKAALLAEAFWPGPLTLVLNKQIAIPDLVTAGKDTVAVRVPNHPETLALLNELAYPLAAPSANPFGAISPTTATHVADYFEKELPMVLDGGACQRGIESTIIGFENGEPILYRLGSLSVEDIEAVAGSVKMITHDNIAPAAPGMLSKHYAPLTTTFLTADVKKKLVTFEDQKIGVLVFRNGINDPRIVQQEILSPSGNLAEAASQLYAALHRLDNSHLDCIIAERFPDFGLGKTINDRLKRATQK
ncbi:L-threonylcarbamoyladenylate synthase [Flavobacterium caseinilyticum]|uniref:Threonylcarbamoyl-AMP synthase n=1 Tax=Flavobacterium caseinilyticum TaxID=2541732 RepID=A0A4R5AS73_9FLAO|nr:L-threonylcarbamoyladenylate synthase [Flavobacterium caseinilyticum]TDD76028.1 threonylcarbamoyl-AMP synthase [Flavobacterium caseinilyticum]